MCTQVGGGGGGVYYNLLGLLTGQSQSNFSSSGAEVFCLLTKVLFTALCALLSVILVFCIYFNIVCWKT